MRKKPVDRNQLDLFKVASIHQFPLHRRAALVRGIADTMVKKQTEKKRLWFINRELNFWYARLLLEGMRGKEAAEEILRFRDVILSTFYKLVYAPRYNINNEGDDAA